MYISLLHLDGTSFGWMWTLLLANAIWYYFISKIWDNGTWLKTRLLVFFTLVAHYMLGSTWTSRLFQGVWNMEL
jgi:biotin transporter BioY